LGYYAYYGLCLMSDQCDSEMTSAADLWTIFGAAVCPLVMLLPPARLAQSRVYGRQGTIDRMVNTTTRVQTLVMSVFWEAQELDETVGHPDAPCGDLYVHSGQERLDASLQLAQSSIDILAELIESLQGDKNAFWWEQARGEDVVLAKLISLFRSMEACYLMQREGAMLAGHAQRYNLVRGDVEEQQALRERLSSASAKLLRLLAINCQMAQLLHQWQLMPVRLLDALFLCCRRRSHSAPLRERLLELAEESKQLTRVLLEVQRRERRIEASRQEGKLLQSGEGRMLFFLSFMWELGCVTSYSKWIQTQVKESCRLKRSNTKLLLRGIIGDCCQGIATALRRMCTGFVSVIWRAIVTALSFHRQPWESWLYATKASLALLICFIMSAYWFDYDSNSVSATAYLIGAPDRDARCLGGTIWKAFCRVLGVVFGGVIPGHIHNWVVPESGLAEDCTAISHVINGIGMFVWAFAGILVYKANNMACTQFGHYGYVGIVVAFLGAEQFLAGCNNQVAVEKLIMQTMGGAAVLLVIECTICPVPGVVSVQRRLGMTLERQAWLLSHESFGKFAAAQLVERQSITRRRSSDGNLQVGSSASRWGRSETEMSRSSSVLDISQHEYPVEWHLTEEISWLTSTALSARADMDQAMTEDTFKLGQLFFLCMPEGFHHEDFPKAFYNQVFDLLFHAHINSIFLLCAREVDRAFQLDIDEADGIGKRWASVEKETAKCLAGSKLALAELEMLVRHVLRHYASVNLQGRTMAVEAAAAMIQHRAATHTVPSMRQIGEPEAEAEAEDALTVGSAGAGAGGGGGGGTERKGSKLVESAAPASTLRDVEIGDAAELSKETLAEAHYIFSSIINLQGRELTQKEEEEMWERFIAEAKCQGDPTTLSNQDLNVILDRFLLQLDEVKRPSTRNLDAFLTIVDRIWHMTRDGLPAAESLDQATPLSTPAHSVRNINYHVAMLDCLFLFALNIRRLCRLLGYNPQRVEDFAEEGWVSSSDSE